MSIQDDKDVKTTDIVLRRYIDYIRNVLTKDDRLLQNDSVREVLRTIDLLNKFYPVALDEEDANTIVPNMSIVNERLGIQVSEGRTESVDIVDGNKKFLARFNIANFGSGQINVDVIFKPGGCTPYALRAWRTGERVLDTHVLSGLVSVSNQIKKEV